MRMCHPCSKTSRTDGTREGHGSRRWRDVKGSLRFSPAIVKNKAMFFVLSKTLAVLLEPLAHPYILLVIAALARLLKRRRLFRYALMAALMLPLLYGFLPVSEAPLRYLENRYPVPQLADKRIDGIIILGGHTGSGLVSATRQQPQQASGADRLTTGLALFRQYPDVVLILSGRSGQLQPTGWNEAEISRKLTESLGVPQLNIIYEDVSRNTYQNAVQSLERAVPQPGSNWVLVTSAAHMPRAVGAFEAAGWQGIIPYPTDYKTTPTITGLYSLPGGIRATRNWLHEWVGNTVYWLTGRSSRLIP